MKKTLCIIVVLLLLCGCRAGFSSLSMPPESSSDPAAHSTNMLGRYVCTNDYIESSRDFFDYYPEYIPSITLNEDGSCELLVNYLEGIYIAHGTYRIEDKQVIVDMEADAIAAVQLDSQYIFEIVDENHIIIDRGFSVAESGDSFFKSNEDLSEHTGKLGKYVCTNDYLEASFDYFAEFPEYIPSVTFNADGSCELVVNYLEGVFTAYGTYHIENQQFIASFEPDSAAGIVLEPIYVFSIAGHNHLSIDKGFGIANPGDSFKKETI